VNFVPILIWLEQKLIDGVLLAYMAVYARPAKLLQFDISAKVLIIRAVRSPKCIV
jgi:hypothetical protein